MLAADFTVAWTLFTAMALNDSSVQSSMIDQIWNFASQNQSQTIFPSVYTMNGIALSGKNAPRSVWLV
jgi:hypothetical protein